MDEKKVPRVVIYVEGGVVKWVRSNAEVEFVVLDSDLINNEDVVGIAQLTKALPPYAPAQQIDPLSLEDHRKSFREEARRRLRLLTQ
jgi:hypothetical protein